MARRRSAPGKASGKFTGGFHVGMDPSPETVREALRGMDKSLHDWTPAWVRIAPVVRAGIVSSIRTRTDPYGGSWVPLNPKYAKRKAHAGFPRAELYRTGRLVASFLDAGNTTMTKTRLKVGTRQPYARTMQFGYMKRGIGARPFMGITPEMRTQSAQAMSDRARELVDIAAAQMRPTGSR